ncbi:hypothetical protein [Anaerovibrio sp. RM50]|uniref:hypothetical protein n=1 Tax=Anaerovibrio sp. RM50 TaxID=1200557 RepID=UPI0012EB9631|nr:hypothetical protein [Anaerovibrio sp. RM50]
MTLALEIEKEKKMSKKEGKLEVAIDLFRKGAITEEVAALAAGVSIEEFRQAALVS